VALRYALNGIGTRYEMVGVGIWVMELGLPYLLSVKKNWLDLAQGYDWWREGWT
jgi:hypothetical protein